MSKRPIIYIIGRNKLHPGINREGWMNFRMASRVSIEETPDAYIFTTTTHGIVPSRLQVWFQNEHLFMEGPLTQKRQGKRPVGRYVRSLITSQPIDPHGIKVLSIIDDVVRIRLAKSVELPPAPPPEIRS